MAGYGIIEYEYVDNNGQVQQVQIADPAICLMSSQKTYFRVISFKICCQLPWR
jgi:hypothetical protein